jgi:predicted TIM-barrel fold metal-dependent hydrolase
VTTQSGLRAIDVDVHTHVPGGLDVLFPFLTATWRSRLEEREHTSLPPSTLPFCDKFRIPAGADRELLDSATSAIELLDQAGIDQCLLLSPQAGALDGMTDRNEAAALATAFNDYHLEHWLSDGRRLKFVATVAPRDPRLAAAEIRRLAGHAGVVAVWVPLLDRLLGSSHYEPILEAAAEVGLPVVVHPTVNYGFSQGSPHYPAGHPASDGERFANLPAIAAANIVDLVWEGTFEKLPRLRVVFMEFGWQWLAALVWKLDASWKAGRRNAPWLKRPPSEYVREHVRVAWDPVGAAPAQDEAELFEMAVAERTLCFGPGYLGASSSDPTSFAPTADAELRQRVLRENALETFGARLVH